MTSILDTLSTIRDIVAIWAAVSIGVAALWAWYRWDKRTAADELADRNAEARALRDARYAHLRHNQTRETQ